MSGVRQHTVEPLRADCSRCQGLCCVAPAFWASSDFAVAKPAGVPCSNLTGDHRCRIHPSLREHGFVGCTVYDCFGAGQRICQESAAGRQWRDDASTAATMYAAFAVMRQLHELLWYLQDAGSREEAAACGPEIGRAERTVRRQADGDLTRLAGLDVAAVRADVAPVLRRVSEAVRTASGPPGPDRSGVDLSGVRLAGEPLRASCLRGAILIGSDLSGADLREADLIGADLRAADLRGADLRGALYLTQTQVNSAVGNGRTQLPDRVTCPAYWAG